MPAIPIPGDRMTWIAVVQSVWTALARMVMPAHRWQCDGEGKRVLRRCIVCGRREELSVDIMNTDWDVIEPGVDALHAARHGQKNAAVPSKEQRPSPRPGRDGDTNEPAASPVHLQYAAEPEIDKH